MKKSLKGKINRYGSLAAGVIGGSAVHGQIIYTDIPDITIDVDTMIFIDLNGDSINDFAIDSRFDFTLGATVFDEIQCLPLGPSGNRVAGSSPLSYAYAFRLDFNQDVGPGLLFLGQTQAGSLSFARNGDFVYNDFWNGGVINGFLGFRMSLGQADSVYYGWARLDVASDGKSYTLKDYAVNMTPNEPINTSHVVGLDKQNLSGLVFRQRGRELYFRLPAGIEATEAELFDMQGRKIKSSRLQPENEEYWHLHDLAAGIYVVRFYNRAAMKEVKLLIH